ncbi:MAG: hypothetical protein MJZ11_08545 [Lachnospiraceae bacterium]|nr:hypothetical protein [Lachnospiraceae bacterium]
MAKNKAMEPIQKTWMVEMTGEEKLEKKKYFVKIKLEEGCHYRDGGFILELSYEELNIELIYQKVQEKLREIGELNLKIVELIDMKSL